MRPPINRSTRGQSRVSRIAALLRRLAERQNGIVTRRQLLASGLDGHSIDRLLGSGQLIRLHPGVYAVGHTVISRRATIRAAVLAAADPIVSHWTAPELLLGLPPRRGPIHLTQPHGTKPPRGAVIHESSLAPDEIWHRPGFRVTSITRTIFDVAAISPAAAVEQLVNEAEYRELISQPKLAEALDRYRGKRGTGKLRRLIGDERFGKGRTRSELERRFQRLLTSHPHLPRPRLNYRIEVGDRRFELDCAWPKQRLAVELDGRTAHDRSLAFDADRARDRALAAAGWTVLRASWHQVTDPIEREHLLADLAHLLINADTSHQTRPPRGP